MRFIAHRGNINGPSDSENSPSQIDYCLNNSIDCEIDLWIQNGVFLLGHDSGQYRIDEDWLLVRKSFLWIHCKNLEGLELLRTKYASSLNFFWHENDSYTLTSRNYVWVYPGQTIIPGSISVLPEHWMVTDRRTEVSKSYAICTDFVERFQNYSF